MVKPTELWNQTQSPVRTRGRATCGAHRHGGGGDTSGSAVRGSSHPPPHLPPPGTAAEPRVPPRCPPGSHLHDGPGPHGQRGEVASAVDGDGLAQDLVQPLHLLPCQHAEALPGALLRAARSLRRQHRPAGSSPRKRCGKQPEIPGWGLWWWGGRKKKKGGGKKTTKPVPSGGSCGRRRTPGGAAGNRSAPRHSRPPPAELSTALARAPPPGYIGAPAAPPLARPRRQSLPGLTAPPAL